MGIFKMFENPRRGRQARNFTTNVPKILDRKSIVFLTDIFDVGCPWSLQSVFVAHQVETAVFAGKDTMETVT